MKQRDTVKKTRGRTNVLSINITSQVIDFKYFNILSFVAFQYTLEILLEQYNTLIVNVIKCS